MLYKLKNGEIINPELFHVLTVEKVRTDYIPETEEYICKDALVGHIYACSDTQDEHDVELCFYNSEEEAVEELDNIMKFVNKS